MGFKSSSFKQHAQGEFSVETIPGTPHCGVRDGLAQFRYHVDAEYGGEALDANGFLLDNLAFQHYFQTLPPCGVSCEQLAERAASHFTDMLKDRLCHVKSMAVGIYPFGEVFVESKIEPNKEGLCQS